MKKYLEKPLVIRELKMVGGAYYNNYGVNCDLMENNQVRMKLFKLGRYVPFHVMTISLEYFLNRFRDESKCDIDLILDALNFVTPSDCQ